MMQLPFTSMLPQTNWKPTQVKDLPVWDKNTRMSIDLETCDPQLRKLGIGVRRDGYSIGVSFAFEDGPGFYLPYGHEGPGNLDKATVFRYLRDQAVRFRGGTIVGANLPYDLDYLAEDKVVFQDATYRDVQVAEPILNEHRMSYSLDNIAKYHNLPGKDETLLKEAAKMFGINPKSEMYKLPPRFVGGYAEQDAHLPHQIIRKQERLLEDQNLWDIYNLESKILPILVKMRRRGVAVDEDRLDQVNTHLIAMELQMCAEINSRSLHNITPEDLNTTAALAPLIKSLGYTLPLTEKTKKPSITKGFLQMLDHPVAKALVAARGFNKMRTTFCQGLRKHIIKGRIHCTFNQLKTDREDGKDTKGTVTGRLSCCQPNLQQQPIRHKTLGAVWRGIYKPDNNGPWVSSDFAAQEPRLAIHYAEILNLPGAKAAGDLYRNDPGADCHEATAKIMGVDRKTAKAIFLGLCYSMGGAKLCDGLGLPTVNKKIRDRFMRVAGPEGDELLRQFNKLAPYVKQLSRACEDKAKNTGLITTLLKRAIHFPIDDLGNFDWTHKALNRLIQSGAADQMKQAMIDADAAGIAIQLQVHDEMNFSAKNKNEAEHLAEVMRNAVKLKVPSRVDLELGPSWGEIDEKGRKQCREFYR